MNRYVSLFVQYVLFLGTGIVLIWWSVRNLTDAEVAHLFSSIRGADLLPVIPVLAMLLLSHYSRALRWRMLMEPLGILPSRANSFFAVMLGYLFNLLVPRMGEVMKCTVLARYERTPVDRLIGTMVAERAMDLVCLLTVVGGTFVFQPDLAGRLLGGMVGSSGQGRSYGLALIAILLVIGIAAWVLMRRYGHLRWIGRLRNAGKGVWLGLTSIRQIRNKPAFLFHTLFIWSMYLLSIRVGFHAMSSVSHLGMLPSLTLLSFGSLAMIVTQGGIGAYQIAVQESLIAYGIPAVNGLAFGWLLWGFQTLLVLAVGVVCLILLPLVNRHRK